MEPHEAHEPRNDAVPRVSHIANKGPVAVAPRLWALHTLVLLDFLETDPQSPHRVAAFVLDLSDVDVADRPMFGLVKPLTPLKGLAEA